MIQKFFSSLRTFSQKQSPRIPRVGGSPIPKIRYFRGVAGMVQSNLPSARNLAQPRWCFGLIPFRAGQMIREELGGHDAHQRAEPFG